VGVGLVLDRCHTSNFIPQLCRASLSHVKIASATLCVEQGKTDGLATDITTEEVSITSDQTISTKGRITRHAVIDD